MPQVRRISDPMEVKALYVKGMSLRQLADKYGVSHTTISNYLKEVGQKRRSMKMVFEEDTE